MYRLANRLLAVFFTLATVGAGGVPALHAQEAAGRKYALLVGVRSYKKDQLRSLKYTENDVNELAALLKDAGYKRVVLMTQTEGADKAERSPTAENVRDQLKGMLEGCRPGDTVIVGFSGHGVQFKDQKEHYFCPMDAKLSDTKSLIALSEVYKDLEACKASARLLLVDACRNDPQSDASKDVAGETLESVTRPQAQRPPGGVAALFSCSEGQKSFEDEKLKHGVFFHFVIEGMKGKAAGKKGDVDILGVARFAQDEVEDYVRENIGPRITQRPNLVGDTSGRFPLITSGGGSGKEIASKTLPGLKLVRIAAKGKTFTMGSPATEKDHQKNETEHEVSFTADYYLGVTHVTRGQFAAFVKDAEYRTEAEKGDGGYGWDSDKKDWVKDKKYHWRTPGFAQTDDHPVLEVSWNDALAFCRWLSGKDGRDYRLPTEAQWEYACRAGSRTRFNFGDDEEDLRKHANVADARFREATGKDWGLKGDDGYAFTSPVGRFPSNGNGLKDMHGNAWQWCADWYGDYPKGSVTDPKGWGRARAG